MRFRLAIVCVCGPLLWLPLWLAGCKGRAEADAAAQADTAAQAEAARALAAASGAGLEAPRGPAPVSSEALAVTRRLQASKLRLAPERHRPRRLAFGGGVIGQLRHDELLVFDSRQLELLSRAPLEGPRALLTQVDGSLLAAGSRGLLRFDPVHKRVQPLARPTLLPGSELLADAIRPDRVWVFDAGGGRAQSTPPSLSSVELDPKAQGVLLPTQTLQLEAGGSGVLGTTREGVWIHWGERRAERFGPGGARLPALVLPEQPPLIWALPARRLDQCYLFDESGGIAKAVVSPTFKKLRSIQLSGTPWAADVGDEGRLLAVVVVAGEGPRFELQLFDADLKQQAAVPLPADSPTGTEDWVKVVTENQSVSVAAREARVVVGGPQRLLVYGAQGHELLSNRSQ